MKRRFVGRSPASPCLAPAPVAVPGRRAAPGPAARCVRLAQVARRVTPLVRMAAVGRPGQETRQFLQGALVHIALELDDHVQRHPVLVPAPGVELGMVGQAQVDVVVARAHAQQEPDLLLPAIMPANLALDEMVGYLIAQPVAGASHDLDMLLPQPDFLLQFAIHRLFGRLAIFNAPLRELPRVLAHPLAPPNLVMSVQEDDADVGAEPFTVEHSAPRYFLRPGAFLHIYPQIRDPTRFSGYENGGKRIKRAHLYKDWTHQPANPLKLG